MGRRHLHWLVFVLFYSIVANVPFWLASRWFGLLPLGWFCIEYAGAGLLALFVSPVLAAAALLLVLAADLLSAVSKTYYLAPTDCLTSLASLQYLPASRLLGIGALAVIVVLVVVAALSLPAANIRGRYRAYAALSLAVFASASIVTDCVSIVHETGHLPGFSRSPRPGDALRFSSYGDLWSSRYPFVRLIRDERIFGRSRGSVQGSLGASPAIASAMAAALHLAGIDSVHPLQPMPNIVLVLTESWGLASVPAIRDALVLPYQLPELLARYQLSQGTVPFFGSTVGGESRELCGSQIGFDIEDVPAQGLAHCLPDRLASLGFHTLAVHGMTGHMFSRQVWYRSIGFQEQWFRDDLRRQGLPDCAGAFIGTCDSAIARWLAQRLTAPGAAPEFTYWVTLNSHLPLPVPSGLANGASCAFTAALSSQPALCSWYQLVANLHRSVAQLALAELSRPTIFVIVGDHAPPFANPSLRAQFSTTQVPYLVLLPRRQTPNPAMQSRRELAGGTVLARPPQP